MPRPPLRGEVFFPDVTLPPGQDVPHRCVVLSPNNLIATQGGRRLFVNVAIIRSATTQQGRSVPLVPGHSIRVTTTELPCLQNDSIIETHQLFALPLAAFDSKNLVG